MIDWLSFIDIVIVNSTAATKAKSREPAYSLALNLNKIVMQWVKIQGVRQTVRPMVDGVWS